jgi:hypothetical protein
LQHQNHGKPWRTNLLQHQNPNKPWTTNPSRHPLLPYPSAAHPQAPRSRVIII